MKAPVRVTIALGKEANTIFEKLKGEMGLSQSEIIRRALKFYFTNRELGKGFDPKKLDVYRDMLSSGEHIILDVDHWNLILKFIEKSKEKEDFWEGHKSVALSHSEQLPKKMKSAEDILFRLEACNFYTMGKSSPSDYTLVLGTEANKKFVKMMLEEIFKGAGFKAEIKEDLTKLRVKIKE